MGEQTHQKDLRSLLNRRIAVSHDHRERSPLHPRVDDAGTSRPGAHQLRAQDHTAESIPLIPVDELPPDVAIYPRTGERLNAEQIYLQQRALENQFAKLGKVVKAHEKVNLRAPNPLSSEIRKEKKHPDSTILNLEHYYGDSYPVGHLTRYGSKMETNGLNDNMKALNFSTTLFGEAKDWWTSLPEGSIKSYTDIVSLFLKRFEKAKKRKIRGTLSWNNPKGARGPPNLP